MSFLFRKVTAPDQEPDAASSILVGDRSVPLVYVRNPKARRYILRLQRDGTARVTLPARGTLKFARDFLQRHVGWLEKQLAKNDRRVIEPAEWRVGADILFRGVLTKLEIADCRLRLGAETVTIRKNQFTALAPDADVRPFVEKHLLKLATREFPLRVQELAGLHGFKVNRVTVRSQRTRWGSCSRRATISMNWRLIHAPPHVLDYLILHELAHLRHMNHSRRYWQEVARLCPDFEVSERWLKANSALLK